MTLGDLLRVLRSQRVSVVMKAGNPVLRGSAKGEDVKEAITEHRVHLVRLAESDALAEHQAGGAAWRVRLQHADDIVRETWALLAHGHEGMGLGRRVAEWLAWEDVGGNGPTPELIER